jgi:hypothetical protein
MNAKFNFTCEAHKLLCIMANGGSEECLDDDIAYDPLEGIPGAAEHLALVTRDEGVQFLGSHETYHAADASDCLQAVDGKSPATMFYTVIGTFPDFSGFEVGQPYCDFHASIDGKVLRLDIQIDDPEAPTFTQYFRRIEKVAA